MEAKFLAGAFSFLSIFLAIYAQSSVSFHNGISNDNNSNDDSIGDDNDEDSTKFPLETAIYYGDSEVHLGQEFSITCIIPIADPIAWLKDGEPIKHHNLRHGRDEHSYNISENPIEGEKHKIEARISVRHALNVHAGKYQCNDRHTSFHTLRVLAPKDDGKPQTKSPFLIGGGGGGDKQLPTESVFETVYDLQPRAPLETLTGSWDSARVMRPNWPGTSMTPTQSVTPHHRAHHHHHSQQQQELQQQQQQQQKDKHKFIFINATNFDGSPHVPPHYNGNRANSEGLLNFEYIQPTTKSNEFTTTNTWSNAPATTYPGAANTLFTTSTANDHIRRPYTPSQQQQQQQQQQYGEHGGAYTTTALMPSTANGYTTTGVRYHHGPVGETLPPVGYGYAGEPGAARYPTYQQPSPPPPVLVTYDPSGMYQSNRPYQQYNQIDTQTPRQTLGAAASPPAAATTLITTTPISKELPFLVPNYDNATAQLKVFEIRSPLVLSCNITQPGDYTLTWEKNGTDVSKVPSLNGRHRIIPNENKFIIEKTDVVDDGQYSCVANNQSRIINVVAKVVVRVPSNTGVVEGEKLSIVCTVVGTNPKLQWKVGNLTLSESTGRYILKPDDHKIENAILSVENISLDDRGEFICIGSNEANEYTNHTVASDASYVRVKGKMAALWPFLGICAEVLVLCTIILIYEKRRNKSELEESDTDPQEQKKKRRNYD